MCFLIFECVDKLSFVEWNLELGREVFRILKFSSCDFFYGFCCSWMDFGKGKFGYVDVLVIGVVGFVFKDSWIICVFFWV